VARGALRRTARDLAGLGLALALAAAGARAESDLALGDAAWALRAEGHDGDGRADPGRVGEAIRAYAAAVAADPAALEPRWKLVRALYFAADFAERGADAALAHLERALAEAEAARALLARRVGGDPEGLAPEALRAALAPDLATDAAATAFWSAVAWGAWGQRQDWMAAIQEGVAGRLYRGARTAEALDPGFEEGGASRLLARIHAQVPRVPFLSGFVDRARAVPEAERALAIAPGHLANRYLLALTLLDVAPERHADAVRLLEEAAAAEPRPDQLVEDLAVRRAARERLALEQGAHTQLAAD
jgi:hypothetical protein